VTSNLPVGSRIVLTIMVSDGGRATTSAYVAQNSKKLEDIAPKYFSSVMRFFFAPAATPVSQSSHAGGPPGTGANRPAA
jgi:hypothetical protein